MNAMKNLFELRTLQGDRERGVGLLDYAVIAALLAVVCISGVRATGIQVGEVMCDTYGGLASTNSDSLISDWAFNPKRKGPGGGGKVCSTTGNKGGGDGGFGF